MSNAATNWEDVYRTQRLRIAQLERENAKLRKALKFAAKAYDDEQSKFELLHRLYDVSYVARKVLERKEAQP